MREGQLGEQIRPACPPTYRTFIPHPPLSTPTMTALSVASAAIVSRLARSSMRTARDRLAIEMMGQGIGAQRYARPSASQH